MSFVLFSLTEQNIFQNKTKQTNKKISTFQHFFFVFFWMIKINVFKFLNNNFLINKQESMTANEKKKFVYIHLFSNDPTHSYFTL